MKNKIDKKKCNIGNKSKNEICFSCNYPSENPSNSVENITDALNHIGVFDSLK